MNKDISPDTSPSYKKRRFADDPEKHQQKSLYELSYLEGLKKSKQQEDEMSTTRSKGATRAPLKYQLHEVDQDQMMLQPLPTSQGGPPLSSRNNITESNQEAASNIASSFAYMS